MSDDRKVVLELPLSPRDCADLAGVSYETILRRIRGGHLKAFKPPGSGDYFVHPQDFANWLYGTPVQPPRRADRGSAPPRRTAPASRGSVSVLSAIEEGAA